MSKRLGFVLVGVGMVVAAIGAARVQGGLSARGLAVQVQNFEGWSLSGPPGPMTPEQRRALTTALASGPLPDGWHRTTSLGKVQASLSGLVDPSTGDVHVVISGMDESADIQTSEVYLNGQLVSTANRSNGQIKDRSGFAILTQSFWAPTQPPFTVELRWHQNDGDVRSQQHFIH